MTMAFREWDQPRFRLAFGSLALLFFLVLHAMSLQGSEFAVDRPIPVQLRPLQVAEGHESQLGAGGNSLVLGGNRHREARAELRFVLPPRQNDSPNWVVWVRRVPLERVQLRLGEYWASPVRSFLTPSPGEGTLPVAYLFRLPTTWEGEIRIEIEASALRATSLRPEVVSEDLADRYLQRATIVTAMAYASLLTLAVVMLALFFASRDVSFLSFFGFLTVSVLQIAGYNGHLYLFDGFGLLAQFGGAGLQAMALLFEISALQIVLRYSELEQFKPNHAKAINLACVVLLLVAGVILAWGARSDGVTAWVIPVCWGVGGVIGLYSLAEAWQRRVPMAGAVLVTAGVLVLAAFFSEAAGYGVIPGSLWIHYGYQIATVLCAAMIGVGLISRISKYRQQRDSEQRARADSERRLYREAIRSELLTALQSELRGASEDEIQPIALRLMLEHLRRIVPTTTTVALARGYHGRDTLSVQPVAYLDGVQAGLNPRLQMIRQQLAGSIELQHPVTKPGESVPVAIEAVVALPLRPPAWGMVLLERSGATVFHPEELNIARELARLMVVQVDEAVAAQHLRHTAEVDALTGALNRRSLDLALTRSFLHGHRHGQPTSVLFVDIDHFKAVNDRLGHACGDHCLRSLARILREQLGEEDLFGRYGGEEFLAILPGRQTEMARAIAEQMRIAVESADVQWQDHKVPLTVSIGVATQLSHESQPQPTVERADKALYAAKRTGRNRVQVARAVFQSRPATA
ncbi:MAG: diguanylate cyclase [Lysobacteraceae bacterium]|nr:MAG: diguanylate cyclase [Xanthomonadaceae bacterium]